MTSPDGHRPEPEKTGPRSPAGDSAPDAAAPEQGTAPRDEHSGTGDGTEGGAGARTDPADPAPGDWQGLHPLTVWADTAVLLLFLVPTAIIGTVVLALVGQPLWAVVPIPAGLAIIAIMTYIDLLRLRAVRYRVTAERMEMRSGIIAKAYRSMPRERVRSVDVAAPIYVRIFGLCSVTVGTGEKVGWNADQLQLLYVTAEQGERLHRELLYRGATAAGTGQGEDAGADGEVELARLDPRWFAYAPATTASLGLGLVVIVSLMGFNAQTEGWAWGLLSDHTFVPTAPEVGAFLLAQALIVVPVFLLSLLVSGVIALLAVAVETWWDYRLTRGADGTVRLGRGLLTRVSMSVEGRRLHGITLREPFVLRSVGGADVRAVATGLAAADDQKTKAKSRLSPPMPRARARELAAALTRSPQSPLDTSLAAHPRAALRRRYVRAAAVTALASLVAGVLAWLQSLTTDHALQVWQKWEVELVVLPVTSGTMSAVPGWGWAASAAVVAVASFWYARGSYRALGHGLHPRYLVMRKGMAARETTVLERSAVIGWRITRSPFQRRLGLAHVSATTAAGTGMYSACDVALGQGLNWADEAVPELLEQFLVRGEPAGAQEGGSVLP